MGKRETRSYGAADITQSPKQRSHARCNIHRFRRKVPETMMKDGDIEIRVSSDTDYEDLVVELYFQGQFICLLSQDQGPENVKIEFPASARTPIVGQSAITELKLSVFEKALQMAKEELR